MSDIVKRLRDLSANIRRRPTPLSDAIPMLQQSADRIEQLERVLLQAREAIEQASSQMEMAGACIEKGFLDEALLHSLSLPRARREAIAAIDEALHTEVIEKR